MKYEIFILYISVIYISLVLGVLLKFLKNGLRGYLLLFSLFTPILLIFICPFIITYKKTKETKTFNYIDLYKSFILMFLVFPVGVSALGDFFIFLNKRLSETNSSKKHFVIIDKIKQISKSDFLQQLKKTWIKTFIDDIKIRLDFPQYPKPYVCNLTQSSPKWKFILNISFCVIIAFFLYSTVNVSYDVSNIPSKSAMPTMPSNLDILTNSNKNTIISNPDMPQSHPLISNQLTTPGFYYQRGFDYHRQGNNDLAVIEFTKAIELEKDYADAYCYRGGAYFELRKYDEAINDWVKYVGLVPDAEYMYRNIAMCYYDKVMYKDASKLNADFTQAMKYLNIAIKLNPESPFNYLYKGLIHERWNNTTEAINAYRKFLQYVPDIQNNIYIELAKNRLSALERESKNP